MHAVPYPKYTSRKRTPYDGEEMICSGEDLYDMDSCELQYTQHGNTYGIQVPKLAEMLKLGIPCLLILSDEETILKLYQMFPDRVVPIFMYGQSKEEFIKQHKDKLDDPYFVQRLEDYSTSLQLYYDLWSKKQGIQHVMLNQGTLKDLKAQFDAIVERHEQNRNLSIEKVQNYLTMVQNFIQPYQQNDERETI